MLSVIKDDVRGRSTMNRESASPPPPGKGGHDLDLHGEGVLIEREEPDEDDMTATTERKSDGPPGSSSSSSSSGGGGGSGGGGHHHGGGDEWVLLDKRHRDSSHYVPHPTIFDFETKTYSKQELEETFGVHLVGRPSQQGSLPASASGAHTRHARPPPPRPTAHPIDHHLEILSPPLVSNVRLGPLLLRRLPQSHLVNFYYYYYHSFAGFSPPERRSLLSGNWCMRLMPMESASPP